MVAALGELRPGARLGGWELRAVSGKEAGARLDFASGGATLHVLVRPHGAIAGPPPASTRRFDVFYEDAHPGEAPVAPDAASALAEQVAAFVRAHE